MKCHEIEPLLAACALGALDGNERLAVETHLGACAACRQALADYQAVTGGLAFAAPPVDPPPALRTRLLAATVPLEPKRGLIERLRATWAQAAQHAAAAAILLLAVVNLALWRQSSQLQAELSRQNQTYQTVMALMTYPDNQVAVLESGDAYGTLIYTPDGQTAVLNIEGLDELPAGQDYQLWLILPDETRLSGGVFDAQPGAGFTSFVIHAPQTMDSFIGVGVTVEPEGGSPGPTGPRVFGAEL